MSGRIKTLCLLLLACLLLPFCALASEESGSDEFIDPTRDPNAPEYKTTTPQLLSADQIVARSFILMERKSREVLMHRDADVQLFPASTTKILTALIALNACELDEIVTVSENAANQPEDASVVPFKAGEQVTMMDALHGLLLSSGNDAAVAIAEHISGDERTFVEQMNQTAQMLGCENTHFENAHGYHHELHQTSARDLATILDAALDNDMFRQIIATEEYDLASNEWNPSRKIRNTNMHLHPLQANGDANNYYYERSVGGKTGFTNNAGYVLVEAAEDNGVELIAVAMYSGKYSRWPDTSRLFSYGFTLYDSVTPEDIYNYVHEDDIQAARAEGRTPEDNRIELQISGFSTDDTNLGRLKLDIRPLDDRTVRFVDKKENIEMILENYSEYSTITYTAEQRAPITQGQVMGVITFYPPGGEDSIEYELLATRSITARVNAPPTLEEIERRVAEDPSPFPPFSWDWVLPPLLGAAFIAIALRVVIGAILRGRKAKRDIPTPKKRTFN